VTLAPAERRLARVPLHAVTSVHGEAGLRERLAMELAGCPAADRARAADALALASRLQRIVTLGSQRQVIAEVIRGTSRGTA
jgi:hypothetical protein